MENVAKAMAAAVRIRSFMEWRWVMVVRMDRMVLGFVPAISRSAGVASAVKQTPCQDRISLHSGGLKAQK
jgi:hypothetical protein